MKGIDRFATQDESKLIKKVDEILNASNKPDEKHVDEYMKQSYDSEDEELGLEMGDDIKVKDDDEYERQAGLWKK